jgi:1,4-dihydroxy-2-naphthoate octaprenyltransferase
MPTLQQYIVATRPWSFSMSVISVALGTLVAWRSGPVHWGAFVAVVAGMVLTHAAGNVVNDYFDSRNRVDQPDSPTVKYRPHPILGGLMSPRALLAEAIVLFALATAIGVGLAAWRTPLVVWLALAGFVLTVFYTGWPIALKYRALGEVAVFLIWGPLMFLGAYAVQRQALGLEAVVASIPFGVLVALVLLANNIRDIVQDTRAGIRTLGTVLGRERALTGFIALMAMAYAYVLAAVIAGLFSPWMLLVFLSAPTAVSLVRTFRQGVPDAADAMTAKLDTVFGLLFVVALVLDRAVLR